MLEHRLPYLRTRWTLVSGGAAAALVAGLVSVPVLGWTAAPAAAPAAPRAILDPQVTGDSRTVTEPAVPGTVCATLAATLSMPHRVATADQEAAAPDTDRIQQALDSCATDTGQVAVELAAGTGGASAFLSRPLIVHQGEVLVVDSGVTLFASTDATAYQLAGGPTCGGLSAPGGGCVPFIHVLGANAGVEGRQDASGSQGTIDGRGDQDILGTSTTWWGLAEQGKAQGLKQSDPRLVQADNSNNFTLYHVNLVNSANFHMSYRNGNGFTAWGVRIKSPANSRNTDGIDPAGSTNVTITNSFIQDGDDGVAIKGATPASNITVSNNHFYGTHGISIGSETNGGVSNVLFTNNTLAGSDSAGIASTLGNGIRIKSSASNGGLVTGVEYDNTCMTGVKYPIVFDPSYSTGGGSSIPWFKGITIDGVRAVNPPTGTTSTLNGYSAAYPLGLTIENVNLDNPTATSQYANVARFNSNIWLFGTGVNVTDLTTDGTAPVCTFPAFPAL